MSRIALVLAFALVFGALGCADRSPERSSSSTQTVQAKIYDCPMHPEVRQATPGTCPKCGMTLVEVVEGTGNPVADPPDEKPHADHSARHGGLFGMQGNYHLELVRSGSTLEVYVYDAFTQALDIPGGRATVTLEFPGEEKLRVNLNPGPSKGLFVGASSKASQAISATIDVALADTALNMTFPLGGRD